MSDDWDPFGSESRDHLDARGAVAGVGAGTDRVVSGAQVVVGGREHAVGESDLNEAVTGGLAHLGIPEVPFDRQHIDSGLGASASFIGVLHVHH